MRGQWCYCVLSTFKTNDLICKHYNQPRPHHVKKITLCFYTRQLPISLNFKEKIEKCMQCQSSGQRWLGIRNLSVTDSVSLLRAPSEQRHHVRCCYPTFICAAIVSVRRGKPLWRLWRNSIKQRVHAVLTSLEYKTLLHNLRSNPSYTKRFNEPKTFDCRNMISSYIYDCRGVAYCLPAASRRRFLIPFFFSSPPPPHIKHRVAPDSSERQSCVLSFSKRHQIFFQKHETEQSIILSKG